MDLHERALADGAYSARPLELLPLDAQILLSGVTAIQLVENGPRAAREKWQRAQLAHLLQHAAAASPWWRERIMSAKGGFSALPVQSRADVAAQTASEGSLAPPPDGAAPLSYASTGSTGAPVRVYTTEANAHYNVQRSLAQYFINDLPLSENRVQISPALSLKAMREPISVMKSSCWAGELSHIFVNGGNREIIHTYAEGAFEALVAELLKSPVGYLNCQSRFIEMLHAFGGAELLGRLGLRAWMHTSDFRSPDMVRVLAELNVPSFSVYSSGETGAIAHECRKTPGFFHVAHTNAIVEADDSLSVEYDGERLSRLLITHLRSYATPIIRYDIGDFARVHRQCPCGHDGAALSHIYGRGKSFVRHSDGRLTPFYLSTRALLKAATFTDCRIRQPEVGVLTVEIGGRDSLSEDEIDGLKRLIGAATDEVFTIVVTAHPQIDWSTQPKRLFFASAVA